MAASVTVLQVGVTMAGFSSNVSARHCLNCKTVQNNQLSSKAGVNSPVILRPRATWIPQSDRCMDVSKLTTQTPSMGTVLMKEVSSHNGFNWSMCATSPGSGGIEPEEPREELSEETCDHHAHEDVDNALDPIKKTLSLDHIKKLKLRIYKEYMEDHLSDDDAFAEARNQAEYEKDIKDMEIIQRLEGLYRTAANAEALRPDVYDLLFLVILVLGLQMFASLASIAGDQLDPFTNLLKFLLSAIKEVFRNVIIEELRKYEP